jgi:predicted nucleic acid-binding protein
MMFLDTTIIVKLLVSEADSGFFQDALAGEPVSASELSLTETWSTLLAKERKGAISSPQRAAAWHVFQERVTSEEILLQPLTSAVLRRANHILEQCHPTVPLRTLDAIHTAACDLSQDFPLCTTDRRMRDAARVLQIPLFPPDDDSTQS